MKPLYDAYITLDPWDESNHSQCYINGRYQWFVDFLRLVKVKYIFPMNNTYSILPYNFKLLTLMWDSPNAGFTYPDKSHWIR